MTPIKQEQREFGKLCYVKGKHIYLGNHEKAILSVASGKSISGDLDAARRKWLLESDCLLHLGLGNWGKVWQDGLREASKADAFQNIKDEADRKIAQEFIQSLAAVRHAFATCKLEGGFGCGCLYVFPKDAKDEVKKFLAALRGGDGASSLAGLPEGNV